MADHYFTHNPLSESNHRELSSTLKGYDLKFTTDSGVFSKGDIDFGTRLLVEHFEPPNVEGDFVDVGCGYGPIGISLAKHFSERMIYMCDVNERALELALLNGRENAVENIKVQKSYLLNELKNREFAAVITNPPIRAGKQVVHQLFEEAYNQLKVDGELWVVIQKKQGAPSAIKKLEELFNEVETVAKSKGYFILLARK